jgi:hypothetical protein
MKRWFRVKVHLCLWSPPDSARNHVSRIWRDRLVSAAAGAILTIAGLWFVLVAGAAASYIFRG